MGCPSKVTDAPASDRVARTASEELHLLRTRPPGWEYLYYGAVLLRRMNELEPRWQEHEMRIRRPGGEGTKRGRSSGLHGSFDKQDGACSRRARPAHEYQVATLCVREAR